ncbi:MAG: hypothetical protein LZF60_80209 [Nitrospira sp.]|nr:MAG: hypothetical protein LZF60_80209 [Nitrospira sp.]
MSEPAAIQINVHSHTKALRAEHEHVRLVELLGIVGGFGYGHDCSETDKGSVSNTYLRFWPVSVDGIGNLTNR